MGLTLLLLRKNQTFFRSQTFLPSSSSERKRNTNHLRRCFSFPFASSNWHLSNFLFSWNWVQEWFYLRLPSLYTFEWKPSFRSLFVQKMFFVEFPSTIETISRYNQNLNSIQFASSPDKRLLIRNALGNGGKQNFFAKTQVPTWLGLLSFLHRILRLSLRVLGFLHFVAICGN